MISNYGQCPTPINVYVPVTHALFQFNNKRANKNKKGRFMPTDTQKIIEQ